MTAGDTAPDLAFRRPDGTPAVISSLIESEYLLVVFLRHLV
jgi:hypothetical protein